MDLGHRLSRPMPIALRTAIAAQMVWMAFAPVQHLLSHLSPEVGSSAVVCVAASPIDDSAPNSQGSAQHPACALCVLFSSNACFNRAPDAAALDLGQSLHPAPPPLPQVTESEYSHAVQARAPPLA
jgi:hypothetical protein